MTCGGMEVRDPGNNELVMSAIEHTVNEINRQNNGILCPDGSDARFCCPSVQ